MQPALPSRPARMPTGVPHNPNPTLAPSGAWHRPLRLAARGTPWQVQTPPNASAQPCLGLVGAALAPSCGQGPLDGPCSAAGYPEQVCAGNNARRGWHGPRIQLWAAGRMTKAAGNPRWPAPRCLQAPASCSGILSQGCRKAPSFHPPLAAPRCSFSWPLSGGGRAQGSPGCTAGVRRG